MSEEEKSSFENFWLSALIESTEDAVISKDLNGYIQSWNPAAERIFGYTSNEVKGKHISIIIPERHREEENYILDLLRRGNRIQHFTTNRKKKNGTEILALINVTAVKDNEGKIIGALKILRDITSQKEREDKQAMLEALVHSSDNPIITKNIYGIISSWNPAAEVLFGYTAKEAIGEHISLIIPKEHRAEEDFIMNEIRKGERIRSFETVRQKKDGGRILVSVNISPIKSADGLITGASKIVTDLSRQEIDDEKKALLAALVQSSEDAIITKDLGGNITSWNHAAEKFFGYTTEEAIGLNIDIILPHDQLDNEAYLMSEIKKGNRVSSFETVRKNRNGTLIPVSITVSPIKDAYGLIIGASNIIRDITFQKQVETKQAMLAAIISTSDDAIISKTLEGIITSWNPAAERIFGYTENEMIGRPMFTLIPDNRHEEEYTILRKIGAGEKIEHFDTIRRRKDGREIPVSITVSPIKDSKGRIIGASKIARDISQRIEWENKLKVQADKLIELNNSKDEFVGIASHELKTPLTSIKAYLQLLTRLMKDPQHINYVSKTLMHVNKLSNLVSELLDVSKIQAGKLDFKITHFDIDDVISESIESVEHTVDTHQVIRVDDLQDIQVEGDKSRIEQVITNYLTNAAKYSPGKDKILVEVKKEPEGVVVSVTDFGVGIPEAHLEKIFSRYYRVEDSSHKFTGLGIGLYISCQIIDRHHGKVWVESEVGKGSVFYFMIPYKQNVKKESGL
jgi:PAS domain S-box-containing protein